MTNLIYDACYDPNNEATNNYNISNFHSCLCTAPVQKKIALTKWFPSAQLIPIQQIMNVIFLEIELQQSHQSHKNHDCSLCYSCTWNTLCSKSNLVRRIQCSWDDECCLGDLHYYCWLLGLAYASLGTFYENSRLWSVRID